MKIVEGSRIGTNRGKVSMKLLAASLLMMIIFLALGYNRLTTRPIESKLSDGRVVFYEKIMDGRKINDSEFEADLYAYSTEYFEPKRGRISELVSLFTHFGGTRRTPWYHFNSAPKRLIGGVIDPVSTAYEPSILGGRHLVFWKSCRTGEAGWINDAPLPMGSAQWEFDFKTPNSSTSIGRITIPNRSFNAAPKFKCQPAPLESRNGTHVLKLVSARSARELMFDATGCPDLLPCQVIGVRVTDGWGNTTLMHGSLAENGIIHTRYVDHTSDLLENPNLHVRVGLCRGLGAAVSPSEVVCFDHLPADGLSTPAMKRTLHGRELTLASTTGYPDQPKNPKEWQKFSATWQLDDKGPVLWPVVSRIVGRTADGGIIEVNPTDNRMSRSQYSVRRHRLKLNGSYDPKQLVPDPLFTADHMVPLNLTEYDLHVILEKPTVFDFYVKIGN